MEQEMKMKREKVPLTIKQIEDRERIIRIVKLVFLYAFLVFAALVVLLPFYWMLATAMKTEAEVRYGFQFFPKELLPFKWWDENVITAMGMANFGLLLKNTVIVGVLTTIGTLVTTVLAAYAFAKLEFKGKNLIFMLFLATMMVPGEMMTITNFITVSRMGGWRNDYRSLTIPFMTSTFYIFFLRQTIKQIPNQLYQAAKIDGVGEFKFLIRIVLPIAKPTIITITILSLLGSWSAYIWPSLIATKENGLDLISSGLKNAFAGEMGASTWLQMAAATVVTVPLLIVFLLLKKYIVRGVARSGTKG